jgi:hypothetical protein
VQLAAVYQPVAGQHLGNAHHLAGIVGPHPCKSSKTKVEVVTSVRNAVDDFLWLEGLLILFNGFGKTIHTIRKHVTLPVFQKLKGST